MKKIIISGIIGLAVGMAAMFFVMGQKGAQYGEECYRYGYEHGAKDYWCKLVNEESMLPKDRHSEFRMSADGTDFFYLTTVLDVE